MFTGKTGIVILQNNLHCHFFYLINVSSIISIMSEGTFENFVKTQEIY